MARTPLLIALCAAAAFAAPAAAQRPWVEAKGPHFTVVSDAGAGRARDIVWQFEQIREAITRTFPWIRSASARPVLVLAARNEASMRSLVPALWDDGRDGSRFVSMSSVGRDRSYIVVRADVRIEDREGISPYQSAYWSYSAQALGETSRALPEWLVRGLAEVLSNTLVRDKEIQVGRTLPENLRLLRSRPRLALKDVVATARGDSGSRGGDALVIFDAHAWALVHFLVWADKGAYAPLLNTYVSGVLNGADPVASIPSTLGDVSRFESAFNVYVNRDVFFYASFATAAKVTREGIIVRDLPAVESTVLRALLHASMNRPDDARAVAAEAGRIGPPDAAAEVLALLADEAGDESTLRDALERAVAQSSVSWYVPYRLATLLPASRGRTSLERVAALLQQATVANPNADGAWAYLGEVLAELGRPDEAVAAAEMGVTLMPSSSAHRLALARTLQRLDRRPEGLKAAGIGRALAKSGDEIAAAHRVLAELAAAANAATAEAVGLETPANASAAAADPAVVEPRSAGDAPAAAPGIARLINECYVDPSACARILSNVVDDCKGGRTLTSTAACREAGYIHDAGVGVPARPALAADFYLLGCNRRDELSCVRLATLRSLGRGVPRDGVAALAVLEPACARGLGEACYRLGLHLAATGVAADRAEAREILTASCQADFQESCEALKKLPPGR